MQEVYPHIFLNDIPLPNNPLKNLNSYIIHSQDRCLIIDTGFNQKACKDAFMGGVDKLEISLAHSDILLTHMHPDHSGLAADLIKEGAHVLIGRKDGEILNDMQNSWKKGLASTPTLYDLEDPGPRRSSYEKPERIDFTPLDEGETIQIGDYSFEVIDIPGHSPGHIGLYEKKYKLFFGGDHILSRITPNITFWGFDQDILETYFNSLEKVYLLEIDYLFPAHRNIIRQPRERINQLFDHHEKRLEEIIKILQTGVKSVRETAQNMHWDLSDHWEEFTDLQKWFAAGEAMAHLEHLVNRGFAERTIIQGTLFYSTAGQGLPVQRKIRADFDSGSGC